MRTYNPPVHIQPGQQTANQRYRGIVEPQGQAANYSIVGSAQPRTTRAQANQNQQTRRRPPQLQNRIAQALSNIAGRGNATQPTTPQRAQEIPRYNPQPAPGIRQVANFEGPQTFQSNAPIGTGVRSFNAYSQPTQRMQQPPRSQFNQKQGFADLQMAQRRVVQMRQEQAAQLRQQHIAQMQQQQAAQMHRHQAAQTPHHVNDQSVLTQRREYPVQQIDSVEPQRAQFGSAQPLVSAPNYYDRPDIQTTSAQQLDDEIYLEDEAEVIIAQTPAHLPSLQDSQTQAEPVSVLNTTPANSDNQLRNNYYQEPANSNFNADTGPSIPAEVNDLRIQEPERFDAGRDGTQDDLENGLENPFKRPCDEMRNELLGRPITDIALDISPLRNKIPADYRPQHRTWTDQFGREIAHGVITAVRRGYVIVDNNGSIQRIPYGNLSDPDLQEVATFWQIPKECLVSQDVFLGRSWAPQTITWKASNVCHKPLYFENIQLERYGHSHGPFAQPVHSTLHFFSNLLLLPYNTGINPPNECRYALGYYRPGNCAPWLKDPFPISLAGTQRQVAAMTGTAFLIVP